MSSEQSSGPGPPPGFDLPQNLSQLEIETLSQYETQILFPCPALNSDISVCAKLLATRGALLQHLKHEMTEAHGTLDLARLLTYTNRGVFCSGDFPNRYQAQRHLQNALARGVCKADMAYMNYQHDLGSCGDRVCKLCGAEFTSWIDLVEHQSAHASELVPDQILVFDALVPEELEEAS